jgi:hypothetical protein
LTYLLYDSTLDDLNEEQILYVDVIEMINFLKVMIDKNKEYKERLPKSNL